MNVMSSRTTARTPPRPTGVNLGLVESSHGPVAMLELTLFDQPATPLTLELLLNPVSADGRDILEGLASQTTLQVLFSDCHTARDIGRRVLWVSAEFRAGARPILEHVG
jgi:hypothetical protein